MLLALKINGRRSGKQSPSEQKKKYNVNQTIKKGSGKEKGRHDFCEISSWVPFSNASQYNTNLQRITDLSSLRWQTNLVVIDPGSGTLGGEPLRLVNAKPSSSTGPLCGGKTVTIMILIDRTTTSALRERDTLSRTVDKTATVVKARRKRNGETVLRSGKGKNFNLDQWCRTAGLETATDTELPTLSPAF